MSKVPEKSFYSTGKSEKRDAKSVSANMRFSGQSQTICYFLKCASRALTGVYDPTYLLFFLDYTTAFDQLQVKSLFKIPLNFYFPARNFQMELVFSQVKPTNKIVNSVSSAGTIYRIVNVFSGKKYKRTRVLSLV